MLTDNVSDIRDYNVTVVEYGLTSFWHNVIGVTLILIGE